MPTKKTPAAARSLGKNSGGRPTGRVKQEGRTERLYVAVTPDQREALERDLLDLKVKAQRPANYSMSQYLYDLLFPDDK